MIKNNSQLDIHDKHLIAEVQSLERKIECRNGGSFFCKRGFEIILMYKTVLYFRLVGFFYSEKIIISVYVLHFANEFIITKEALLRVLEIYS